MRRRDGEYPRSETKEFHGSHEERGQSWPRDVRRHVGSANEEVFGQDWPSDVRGGASRPLVEGRGLRWSGNRPQMSAMESGRRRTARRSGRTSNRPGRMRRWLSRFMELIRLRSR